jgi:dipeptidyl aminopeptidase/acylaminoacyl peptidase
MDSATGSGQTNLTNYFVDDDDPDWSPDGTKVAYSFGNLGERDIAVMDSAGIDSILLTNSPGVDDFAPSWSPSGTHIAFTRNDSDDEIYVMKADGSGLTNLTNDAADDDSPSWSPDCTSIAFRSTFTGFEEVWVVDIGGNDFVNLSNSGPAAPIDSSPDWQTLPGAGNSDCDADGFPNVAENACGSDLYDSASVPERIDTPEDDDGDTQINEALPPGAQSFDCDGDSTVDSSDNCLQVPNAGQEDVDGDGAGDACDAPGSGNVDCSGPPNGVSAVDALKVLRHSATLSVTQNEPCVDIAQPRNLPPPDNWLMGDVNCSGTVNSVDALLILRAVAALSVLIPGGCPGIKPP